MRWHGKSKRKYTGGRLHYSRRKKAFEAGRPATDTVIGTERRKKVRTMGGKGNTANTFFVRRNITTKGAVIETDLGDAVVTSRPGSDGIVNAKLI
jgi:small subunit ribosomal protein S8e